MTAAGVIQWWKILSLAGCISFHFPTAFLNCRTVRHPVSLLLEWGKLLYLILGTRLRCRMPECRCQQHRPRCRCLAMVISYNINRINDVFLGYHSKNQKNTSNKSLNIISAHTYRRHWYNLMKNNGDDHFHFLLFHKFGTMSPLWLWAGFILYIGKENFLQWG
jgi:hypothetical protein